MSAGWTTVFCLLAGTVCILIWLRPAACPKPTPSTADLDRDPSPPRHRGVHLEEVKLDRDEADTDIDIIAIHGLDTTSRDTWTWKDPRDPKNKSTWVNWLHPGMLPTSVDRVRVFTCDWPADLLVPSDLVQKTIEEYALLLLEGIDRALFAGSARKPDRPMVFIASCLGGIILMRALVHAGYKNDYSRLRRATRGIVFLATPFRGTSFQDVAAWADIGLRAKASFQGRRVSKLLDSVKGSTFTLEDSVSELTRLCQDPDSPCEVFSFYELGTTSLPHKAFPWLPGWFHQRKQLVDRSSATLDIIRNPLPLDRPHSLMNKFRDSQCPDYKKVASKIQRMVEKIRTGTPLEQADKLIHDKHYTAERQKVERLSGELLPMDQCYINLAGNKARGILKRVEWCVRETTRLRALRAGLQEGTQRLTLLSNLSARKYALIANTTLLARIDHIQQICKDNHHQILQMLEEQRLKSIEQQEKSLSVIMHQLDATETMSRTAMSHVGGALQGLLEIKDLMVSLLQTAVNLQVTASRGLDPTRELPVILEDALGRPLEIPAQWLDTLEWNALNFLLAGYFKGKKGHDMVQRRQYALEDGSSGKDINAEAPLCHSLRRGMKIHMSMVFFESKILAGVCPRCHAVTDAPKGPTIQCSVPDCGMWFRMEKMITDPSRRQTTCKPTRNQPGAALAEQTTSGMSIPAEPGDFRRVRLLHVEEGFGPSIDAHTNQIITEDSMQFTVSTSGTIGSPLGGNTTKGEIGATFEERYGKGFRLITHGTTGSPFGGNTAKSEIGATFEERYGKGFRLI